MEYLRLIDTSFKKWLNQLSYLRTKYTAIEYDRSPTWSKYVRHKNNNMCVVCENKNEIQAHHIFYKSKYPQLQHNLNNGITLCHTCHKEVHQFD